MKSVIEGVARTSEEYGISAGLNSTVSSGIDMSVEALNPYQGSLSDVKFTINIPDLITEYSPDFKMIVSILKEELNVSNPNPIDYTTSSSSTQFIFTKTGVGKTNTLIISGVTLSSTSTQTILAQVSVYFKKTENSECLSYEKNDFSQSITLLNHEVVALNRLKTKPSNYQISLHQNITGSSNIEFSLALVPDPVSCTLKSG